MRISYEVRDTVSVHHICQYDWKYQVKNSMPWIPTAGAVAGALVRSPMGNPVGGLRLLDLNRSHSLLCINEMSNP